ncbi:MAG: glycosyltransferase family 4 protein [Anaerolineae bacterium]|nr:glycosyltransferase family 4 protein [Anaerolineae bacterium]
MNITVDPIIYQKRASGGVARLFSETFPRMCDQDRSVRIVFELDERRGSLQQPLPQHTQIRVWHVSPPAPALASRWRPYRFWKRVDTLKDAAVRRRDEYRSRGKIWHSTYFTLRENWGGKQVVTVYDMVYHVFPELFSEPKHEKTRITHCHCIESADAVICISDSTRQDVARFCDVKTGNLHVIPLGLSHHFRQLNDITRCSKTGERPFLLYVGGRGPHKNVEGLFRAYSRWHRHQEISLVVVGRPWQPREEQLIADLQLTGHVKLLSSVDDERLCRLYNQAAAFVYPSLYEGFGIPLLEAMACGCPVVASRIPTSVEITSDIPFYFELDDSESMIAAFDLALSEGRKPERVKAGFALTQHYSWDKTAEQTLEVYRSLV